MYPVVGRDKKNKNKKSGPTIWPQPRDVDDDNLSFASTLYNLGPAGWFRGGGGGSVFGGGDRSVVGFVPPARAAGVRDTPTGPRSSRGAGAVAWSQPRMVEDDDLSLATFQYIRGPKGREGNRGGRWAVREVEETAAGPRVQKRWTKSMATNIPPDAVSPSDRGAIKSLLPHVPPGYMIVKDPYAPTIAHHGKDSVIFDVLRANLPPGYGIVKLASERLDSGIRSTAKGSTKKKELTYFRSLFFKGKMGEEPTAYRERGGSSKVQPKNDTALRPVHYPAKDVPGKTRRMPPNHHLPHDSVRDLMDAEIEREEYATVFDSDRRGTTGATEEGRRKSEAPSFRRPAKMPLRSVPEEEPHLIPPSPSSNNSQIDSVLDAALTEIEREEYASLFDPDHHKTKHKSFKKSQEPTTDFGGASDISPSCPPQQPLDYVEGYESLPLHRQPHSVRVEAYDHKQKKHKITHVEAFGGLEPDDGTFVQAYGRQDDNKLAEQKVHELSQEPRERQAQYVDEYDETFPVSEDQLQQTEYPDGASLAAGSYGYVSTAYNKPPEYVDDDYAYGTDGYTVQSYTNRDDILSFEDRSGDETMTPTIETQGPTIQKLCRFKYYRVDASGNTLGCSSTPGSFDGTVLDLGYDLISIDDIEAADGTTSCLIVEVKQQAQQSRSIDGNMSHTNMHVLKICDGKWTADELGRRINQFASYRKAMQITGSFEGAQDPLVLAMYCPHCSSTITVSKLINSPQIYCGYCKRVFMRNKVTTSANVEGSLQVCDRCKFYGQVENFKYGYFWIGLGSINWQSNQRRICHGCTNKKARKTLMANIPCILGIPSSLCSLLDANSHPKLASVDSKLIDKANAILRKEKKKSARNRNEENIHEAMEMYRDIIRRKEISAEIHYNLGRAYLIRQDFENAISSLESSIADCGNYQPAIDILMVCYGLTNASPEKVLRLKERLRDFHSADFGEIAGHKCTKRSIKIKC